MIGGDEVSAVVVDIGSHSTRAGFAGEDQPKAVFPSAAGVLYSTPEGDGAIGDTKGTYSVGTGRLFSSIAYSKEGMEMKRAMDGGLIKNYDVMHSLLEHTFDECLHINPAEHPLMFTEPSFNTQELRERLTEEIFETYAVPGFFVAKSAVLSAFSVGKGSGLVLDVGASTASVVAVHDGYVLNKATKISPFAGDFLTGELKTSLASRGVATHPHNSIKKTEVKPGEFRVEMREKLAAESYHNFMVDNLLDEVKTSVLCVNEDGNFDEKTPLPNMTYELPDGSPVELGYDRYRIPELLFNPSSHPLGAGQLGHAAMLHECVNSLDVDLRREMYNNLVLTGGTTLVTGYVERLTRELNSGLTTQRARITTPPSVSERRSSAWVGGSILGSLGTLQQLWMSKQEYEEHGKSLVERKCP